MSSRRQWSARVFTAGWISIAASWSRRIDAFIRMLEPWGIIEVARSGMVAMLRSPVSGTPQSALTRQAATVVDAASLPPG